MQTWDRSKFANKNAPDYPPNLDAAFETINTMWAGSSDPSSPVAFEGCINTTEGKIKRRNETNDGYIVLGDFAEDMGHLRRDGTNSMQAGVAFDFNAGALKDPKRTATTSAPTGNPIAKLEVIDAGDAVVGEVPIYTPWT